MHDSSLRDDLLQRLDSYSMNRAADVAVSADNTHGGINAAYECIKAKAQAYPLPFDITPHEVAHGLLEHYAKKLPQDSIRRGMWLTELQRINLAANPPLSRRPHEMRASDGSGL